MSAPLIMGILNVTPDSFSDGGRWDSLEPALRHARQMWADGAAIIDVGGESTRPTATRMSAEGEWARISAIVPALVDEGMVVSVDTVNSGTARLALEHGVQIINDVSGGCHDADMARVIADSDAQFVVQHWRGFPSQPDQDLSYGDPVAEGIGETLAQVERAVELGVQRDRIVIDPGLGFAFTSADCWRTVDNLETWVLSGYPVLVGASRKRFLRDRYGEQLEEATQEVTRRSVEAGAWAVRVHDVGPNRQIVDGLGA